MVNKSIRSYLVPNCGSMSDLEKVVPPSIVEAVWKEVESTTRAAEGEQSRLVAMGSKKRGQYDKTITETQNARIDRYIAENGIAAALRQLRQSKA